MKEIPKVVFAKTLTRIEGPQGRIADVYRPRGDR
jgi:hypothetical protein